MKSPKQELLELLERLPEDATMDSLLAEMHFKASVLRGLEQAARGEGVAHEEIKERLTTWRESAGRQKLSET
jgi:predicted transcriptional regulator